MSIASEITRLQGVKSDILQAISDKGVVVPAGSALDDCPGLIASISGGGGAVAITTKMIDSEVGIKVVDENGYVGATLTNYFPHAGNTYYNNYAIVVDGADFSGSGLGKVTFIVPGTADVGGHTYRTVNIGGVTWMAQNLDYKFSGVTIGNMSTDTSVGRAAYYNNDEATYGWDATGDRKQYGLLYNWTAVKLLNDNRDTLCPGWHVPTRAEWAALVSAVGENPGTKLKSMTGWSSGAGTDDYGFSAVPAGTWYNGFYSIDSYANFWTSEPSESYAWYRDIDTGTSVYEYSGYQYYGFSVRLVQDS